MVVALSGAASGLIDALIDHLVGFDVRVFQNLTSLEGVQEIGIDRERRLAALVLGDGDLVLFGEAMSLVRLSRCHSRQVDVRIGLERSSSSRSGPGRCPCPSHHGRRRRRRACWRCRSASWRSAGGQSRCRVLALIDRVGAEHQEDIVAHEFVAGDLDEDVLELIPSRRAFSRAGSSSPPWPRSAVKVMTSQPYSVCSHFRMTGCRDRPNRRERLSWGRRPWACVPGVGLRGAS